MYFYYKHHFSYSCIMSNHVQQNSVELKSSNIAQGNGYQELDLTDMQFVCLLTNKFEILKTQHIFISLCVCVLKVGNYNNGAGFRCCGSLSLLSVCYGCTTTSFCAMAEVVSSITECLPQHRRHSSFWTSNIYWQRVGGVQIRTWYETCTYISIKTHCAACTTFMEFDKTFWEIGAISLHLTVIIRRCVKL